MKRRLYNLLTLTSLLLCIVTCLFWAGLRTRVIHIQLHGRFATPWSTPRVEYAGGLSNDSIILVREKRLPTSVPGPFLPANRIATPKIIAWENTFGTPSGWHKAGFAWSSTLLTGTDSHSQLWAVSWAYSLRIPYWFLAALFALLPATRAILHLASRKAARLRQGLCPTCGYDLRASKDRCPECGTPIPLSVLP